MGPYEDEGTLCPNTSAVVYSDTDSDHPTHSVTQADILPTSCHMPPIDPPVQRSTLP